MTTYTYTDQYLKKHVTDDMETRATADVANYGTFAADWTAKLIVLRAYILACLECQSGADDLFAQKLKAYRQEFEARLIQARAATPDPVTGKSATLFSISLERA